MKRKELERLPVMNIEVTDVKIYPFDTTGIGGNVKAVATISNAKVVLPKLGRAAKIIKSAFCKPANVLSKS